ncbi:MAG: KTSC domain-containing protein [Bacteroidota bacterium]
MILKKQEKNGKIKAMYSSSTICASIFDTATKDLTVIFNNGGQYKYTSVELTDYTRFETADSNGTIFNTYIKKKYTNFEKLDKLDENNIKSILKEVDELKTAEEKASTEGAAKSMMEVMAGMVANYISTGNVDSSMLRKLESKIAAYDKATNPQPETAEA